MKKNSLTTTDQSSIQAPQIILDPDSGYGYEYQNTGNSGSQKHQIRKFLSVLLRYWLLIFAAVLLGTAAVLFYEAQKSDFYVATTTIQVNNETNPAAGGGNGSSIVLSQGSDPAYFATQLRILESSGLLRRVVKAIDLEHNDAFLNSEKRNKRNAWQNVLRLFGLYKPARTVSEPTVDSKKAGDLELSRETETELDRQADKLAPYVAALKRNLTISPVKDSRTASKETRLIDIRFQHSDPVITAKVTNAIADIYVLQNLERKVETNASASEFLEKRVAELQNQIRTREERLINYSKDNQIISLDSNQNTVVQRLGSLNSALASAENERIAAEAAYLAAKQNPMSDVVAEGSDPRTSGLENQLAGLRQQLALLKTEYTDEWPEVQRIKGQIAQIENELKTNKKRAQDTQASMLEQKYREAAAKERELRSNFDVQRNAVLAQNEAAINYRIIQQEIDTNRSMLNSLLQKSKETDVILNGTPNNVLVSDVATVPQNPNGPQRAKNIFIALFTSLFVGIGLAFAANWLDDRIRFHDDIQSEVGLPVVGMIPGIHKRKLIRAFSLPRLLGGGHNGKAKTLPKNFDQPIVIEAFNEVRASLILSSENIVPQTVLVTSGLPNEGKTLTSLNLAKCLAQLGGKVLLIDADLRCPQMHVINGINNEIGLSSLLTSKTTCRESIDRAISQQISANLDVLTSGPTVPDPATLLSLSKLRKVIELLGNEYRYIVIDSPPVLYFADSILLANNVDSVLIVGRMNFSSAEFLTLAKNKLQNVNANIVGVVLNDVPIKNHRYSNYGYYVNDTVITSTNGNGSLSGNGNGTVHRNGGNILDLE
ncbi:MAG: GumC family protein [Pyrinomonadaceae bacterium]